MDDSGWAVAGGRQERDGALTRTLWTSAGVQVVQIAVAFGTLPIAARSLGASEFGVLVLLTGLSAFLSFADLGVGSALVARVASARGSSDDDALQESMGTALALTAVCGLVLLVGGLSAAMFAPWRTLLGTSGISDATLTTAVAAAVLGAVATVVGSLGHRVLYGAHHGHVANRWLAGGLAAGAAATVISGALDLPLVAFVISALLVPGLVSLVCTARAVRRVSGSTILKVARRARRATARSMVEPSFWFFLIGLSGSLAYQTDAFVVANVLGSAAAGTYAVASRLFGIIPLVAYQVMLQFWPTVVESLAQDDHDWVASRYFRSVGFGVAASALGSSVLILVAGPTIGVVLSDDLAPSRSLVIALALWTVYTVAALPTFSILNAVGRVRLHAGIAVLVCIVNVPLTILLTSKIGIEGAVYGSLFSNAAITLGPAAWITRRVHGRRL